MGYQIFRHFCHFRCIRAYTVNMCARLNQFAVKNSLLGGGYGGYDIRILNGCGSIGDCFNGDPEGRAEFFLHNSGKVFTSFS